MLALFFQFVPCSPALSGNKAMLFACQINAVGNAGNGGALLNAGGRMQRSGGHKQHPFHGALGKLPQNSGTQHHRTAAAAGAAGANVKRTP